MLSNIWYASKALRPYFAALSYVRLGLPGNHPFFTLSSWCISSWMLHRHAKPATPTIEAATKLFMNTDAMISARPAAKKTGHIPFPK